MKIWKRVLSATLATAMVLGLCACTKESGANGGIGGGSSLKAEKDGTALAKEYIYSLEEFDLSGIPNQNDCTIMDISEHNNVLYMVTRSYNQDFHEEYKLVKMNTDGTGFTLMDMQLGMGTGEESIEAETADSSEETSEEDGLNVFENTGFANFAFRGDEFYAVKTYTFEDYSNPDEYVSIVENYVCCWDYEGNMKWEAPVKLTDAVGSWAYISALTIIPGGNIALLVGGDTQGIIEISTTGVAQELKAMPDLEKYLVNPGYTAEAPNNRMLLSYYSDDWSKLSVLFYNFNDGTMTADFPLPANITYNGLSNLCVDKKDDLIYTNSQGVFKYHIGDKDAKQMMSFVNSDLNISHFDAFLYLDDKQFIGFYSVYDEINYTRTIEGGIFTKVNPEDVPDKELLVLATNYIANDIKQRVVDFNKSSQTHRIMIKDYSQYVSDEDYMAGYTQLNNDIIAGNMPDILVVDSNMSLGSYASKGLLADIGELIAKDEELSKEEYMTNVFEACKLDGKLYEIIPSFYVSTYLGKKSLIGEPKEWTLQEAQAVVDRMPEGAQLFSEMTRGGYISTVYEICGNEFIDDATGKCSFDSPEFIAIMEYANTLPEEIDDSYYEGDWYTSYESQYREDRTLLSNHSISGMESLVYAINGTFGEEVTCVGLPSSGGNGAALYVGNSYAISAKSKHQDVAWEFMRYYLTDEYQNTLEWQLPISKDRFEVLAQKATKNPVYKDENGNEVEDSYHYWINDEDVILEPLTQEQVDEISAYIATVDTRAWQNSEIRNILDEEMAAYFSGQKSAKEVAGLIQNRVQLMVNENR
ncbi:MAG: extracellular solute-binding protein [Lachnospiraceae bacterium]|nr:extracellular solute-binding protein [Lachnospiraceae bacterium]